MAKTQTRAAKKTTPVVKATRNTKPVPAPAPERQDNRYLRAAKILVKMGGNPTDVDLIELSVRAQMSPATASHCLSAFVGVCQALREAGMLPTRKAPATQPTAPKKRETRAAGNPAPEPTDVAPEAAPATTPEPEPALADA